MGQFSWKTQDNNQTIRNNGGQSASSKRKRKAYLHDNKGNQWEELDYEGYGVFGGKDYYVLLAEMNNAEGLTGNVDTDRGIGIDLAFGKNAIIYPNLTRNKEWEWINSEPPNCPNQGWSDK